mmetsp:Transcript_43779/g.126532  ORF Transcript_43779/g.126532 Transcript_43779/m.126532 type:complete len:219 (-) Transcript_43779:542-1198(-)
MVIPLSAGAAELFAGTAFAGAAFAGASAPRGLAVTAALSPALGSGCKTLRRTGGDAPPSKGLLAPTSRSEVWRLAGGCGSGTSTSAGLCNDCAVIMISCSGTLRLTISTELSGCLTSSLGTSLLLAASLSCERPREASSSLMHLARALWESESCSWLLASSCRALLSSASLSARRSLRRPTSGLSPPLGLASLLTSKGAPEASFSSSGCREFCKVSSI